MEVSDFHKDFLEEIKTTAATDGSGSNAAFIDVVINYLINAEVLPDFNSAFYVGTGKNNRKLRVDGYVLDEIDFTLNLVVADYTGEEKRDVVTKRDAELFFERVMYFVEEVYKGKLAKNIEPSTPVSDLVELLIQYKEKIRKFRLILLTDGFMSNRITEISLKSFENIPVECQIWDVDRLFRVCFSDLGRQDIEIDFKEYTDGKGIPCIEASSANSEDYRSYLCIIPGNVLADVYDEYGSQLLEGNVRSFLSTKVAVNKKIRETILRMPHNFFAYNNGVSATAMNLRIETSPEGRFITSAKDFQIINGGQTTASLSNARFKDGADISQIYVQMKLTEVDSNSDKATELIRNISRSSNSQNKVNDADFFATHPFHVRMEQISRRIFAPASGGVQYETKWFYERARGQYIQSQMHMTKSQKDKFVMQNPKKQVITKTDIAKYRNSWSGLPHVVSKGAQTNFMKFAEIIDERWSKSEIQYNDKYFKDSVSLAILFKHVESVVSHQEWFEQGYRANIVTYTIALLHKLILSQFKDMDLDLQSIWNKQSIPDVLTQELVTITRFVFEKITDPDRGTINVTQWCKRESCWSEVQKCDIKLSKNLESILLSKDSEKTSEKKAKKTQKIYSDAEAQIRVVELGAEFWMRVNEFVALKNITLSPDQETAIICAQRMPKKIPNPYQCLKLMRLLEGVEVEGFK